MAGARELLEQMTARLGLAFLLLAALFLLMPELDLWTSRAFSRGGEFPLAGSEALETVRNAIWSASTLVALGGLALWVIWLPLGRAAQVPGRLWGWIAALYVIGPGLLVNAILKEHWGRARPAYVFRGEAEFSRPFLISDQCESNCSFASGEASAAAALAIVVGVLLWPKLTGLYRTLVVAALAAIAVAAASMRVLTGRHFVSDVVFAGFFTAFVAIGLWHLLRVGPARDALSLKALGADMRELGRRAGGLWRRITG